MANATCLLKSYSVSLLPTLGLIFRGASVRTGKAMIMKAGGSAPLVGDPDFPHLQAPVVTQLNLVTHHNSQCSLSRALYKGYKDISKVEQRRKLQIFPNKQLFSYSLLVFLLFICIFSVLVISYTKLAFAPVLLKNNLLALFF